MAATGATAGETAVIRKYANRRLYDTSRARCVTLAELARRIEGGERVRVVEARGGADVTRQVLAQILCEGEAGDKGVLGEDVLARLIHLSRRPAGRRVSGALAQALDRLADRDGPESRAAAMLRPRRAGTTHMVAARLDVLEARLRALINGADAGAARRTRQK